MHEDGTKSFIVGPGEGTPGTAQSGPYTEIASMADTGGYRLIYNEFPPDHWAHEPHAHDDAEAFYVLEGSYEMHIGDDVSIVEAGAFVFIPSGMTHTFRSLSEGARKLTILS